MSENITLESIKPLEGDTFKLKLEDGKELDLVRTEVHEKEKDIDKISKIYHSEYLPPYPAQAIWSALTVSMHVRPDKFFRRTLNTEGIND